MINSSNTCIAYARVVCSYGSKPKILATIPASCGSTFDIVCFSTVLYTHWGMILLTTVYHYL